MRGVQSFEESLKEISGTPRNLIGKEHAVNPKMDRKTYEVTRSVLARKH